MGAVTSVLRHRAGLALVSLVLTTAAMVYVFVAPSVFWAQVDVVLLNPQSEGAPNTFQVTQTDAIIMAAIVQREVAGYPTARVASDDVTIVGQGLRDGTWYRVPNTGGQWANNFERPIVNIQVVSGTRDGAAQRLSEAVDRISESLRSRQEAAGVRPAARYGILTSPSEVETRDGRGNRPAAAATTLVIGFLVSAALWRAAPMPERRAAVAEARTSSTSRGAPLSASRG